MVSELRHGAKSRAIGTNHGIAFQWTKDPMAKMADKFFVWMDQLVSQSTKEHEETSQAPPRTHGTRQTINLNQQGSTTSYAPKLVKLDFSRYNGGEDPTSWLCKFFQFQETPETDQVSLASFHLEGDAQLWYQLLKQDMSHLIWDGFRKELLSRFGPSQFCDFFGELTKLQRHGTVQEYQSQFERLLTKVGHLPQAQQVS